MKVEFKEIHELSGKEYRSLIKLNKGGAGMMQRLLRKFRKYPDTEYKKPHAVMLKDEKDKIIAWSLVFWRGYDGGWVSHYYTRASHRRRGHGKTLINEVRAMFGETVVYPNAPDSHAFFKSVEDKVDIQ